MPKIDKAIEHLERAKKSILRLVDYPEENGERSDMIRAHAMDTCNCMDDALIVLRKTCRYTR